MNHLLTRRRVLQSTLIAAGSSILAACGGGNAPAKLPQQTANANHAHPSSHTPNRPHSRKPRRTKHHAPVCLIGIAEDPSRIETGLSRLFQAGFVINNHTAAYRRFQRFAGSDAERIADLQDVATGRVATPKC